MGVDTPLALADIDRAIAANDPALGELIVRYLAQPDPEPGRPETDPKRDEDDEVDAAALAAGGDDDEDSDDDDDFDDDDDADGDVPAGAYTLDSLEDALRKLRWGKSGTEKKLGRQEAFAAAEASPFAPPRLRLGKKLLALYEAGEPAGRAALMHVFAHGELRWGMWQGAKAIYKLAEQRHDAAMFGALAARFEAQRPLGDVSPATMHYLRVRAWRYLRLLGRAVPGAYAVFAVEVLRHFGPQFTNNYVAGWVVPHIFRRTAGRYAKLPTWQLDTTAAGLAARAYPEAWQLSPAPLLRLLEVAQNDLVCDFAIASLRADHPLALRAVEPAWLAQLARRPLGAVHGFVAQLLRESPEFHQSKLRGLGLHDAVLGFLRSPSAEARAYALEYAAAHAPDIAVGELVELIVADGAAAEVQKFAAARLEAMAPKAIGVVALCRLLDRKAAPWAGAKLREGFHPRDVDRQTFVDTALRGGGAGAYNALVELWNHANAALPAAYLTALIDDERSREYGLRPVARSAFENLGKRGAREIGVAWLQRALENPDRTQVVAGWLDAGMLAGADLDVDWLRALVAKPRLQAIALRLLGNRRLVEPARVGLAWLMEQARSTEPTIASFAQRMLLESFEPRDFGGVEKIWALATGAKQPVAVRAFAATYLKAHHPELGPQLPEAKALGIKPRLGHDAYALATLRPLLADERADVRRLAVAIAGAEIAGWNDPGLVYELAGSPHREPRALGGELLLNTADAAAGVAADANARRVPAAWIDGRRLFQLAESPHKAAREVALTLIRRLYDRVGGAERLAWLMDAPDRDVRLFAVRLFWDRHRPRALPAEFQPRKSKGGAAAAQVGTQPFADVAALRQFARVVLFGLPPGRAGERDPIAPGAPAPERALAASVAKHRLIEALRDVALDDADFARAIAPVLGEMSSSLAKGEWQASVQALVQLRAKHGDLGPASAALGGAT